MEDKQHVLEAFSTMHRHMPHMTSLTVKGLPSRCADLFDIGRILTLQHLMYICTYIEHYQDHQQEERVDYFDITKDYLLAAAREEGTQRIVQSMTESVYQALGSMQRLSSLQVDIGSPHMTLLKGLKVLSVTKSEAGWEFPFGFTTLTNLSELSLSGESCRWSNPQIPLSSVQFLPYICKATFHFEADSHIWGFLADLVTVNDLTLQHCNLSNEAFQAVGQLTQLTSLDFTMSRTFKGLVDIEALHALEKLVQLSELHGKFVLRRNHVNEYRLSVWHDGLSESPAFLSIPDVQLKLVQIWMIVLTILLMKHDLHHAQVQLDAVCRDFMSQYYLTASDSRSVDVSELVI